MQLRLFSKLVWFIAKFSLYDPGNEYYKAIRLTNSTYSDVTLVIPVNCKIVFISIGILSSGLFHMILIIDLCMKYIQD